MFYSLLDLIICPACQGELVLVCPVEQAEATMMVMPPAQRLGPPGAPVGPLPSRAANTSLWHLLAPAASPPAPAARDHEVAIVAGVLVCPYCERWYPIRDRLPELLPDHLRRWEADRAWLAARRPDFAAGGLEALWQALMARGPAPAAPNADAGAHYKQSEMAITHNNLRDSFFGPARVAPFNPSRPSFTLDLLARYVTTVSRLGCGMHGAVLDIGVGYAWTTEWLVRLGYQAVGVDITRDYILAGYPRLGAFVPHLIVADTENLPLRSESMDAVLSYDAFHHLPDRPRAMRGLARVMRPGTRLVLVEPGKQHEAEPGSVAVMEQFGILERGFDQADLAGYIQGTDLGQITHHKSDTHPHDVFVVRKAGVFQADSRSPLTLAAEIVIEAGPPPVRAGQPPSLTLALANLGDTTWLHATPDGRGEVQLSGDLFDAAHHLLLEDYLRLRLPRTLRPGQRLRLACALPAVLRPGQYWIELDLVAQDVMRFKDLGYRTVQLALEVTAQGADGAGADGALVASPAGPETAAELAFDPAYRLARRPDGSTELRWAWLPRILWRTLKTEGAGSLLRKSLNYLRTR